MLVETAGQYDALPARTPTRWAVDTRARAGYTLISCSAQASLCLGDFRRARRSAADALAIVCDASPGSSPRGEVIKRADLGLAFAHLGEPEEAAALGRQALDSAHLVHSGLIRVRELDATLTDRYPDVAEVRDLHDRCRLA
jgi:hypothetical protein